ncbi:MAG: hypothetical protein ACQES1_09850, partial [Bacteroidota bacterium]
IVPFRAIVAFVNPNANHAYRLSFTEYPFVIIRANSWTQQKLPQTAHLWKSTAHRPPNAEYRKTKTKSLSFLYSFVSDYYLSL